jgi:hypothetical protein
MGYVADPDQADGDQFDVSELVCPKCGCNDVRVITFPRGTRPRQAADGRWTGAWFGGSGKARCNFCRVEFPIYLEEESTQEQEY